MARLPQPGGDEGTWGNILNDYLAQSHKSDGTLKDDVVTATQIPDGAIIETLLSTSVQTKLNQSGVIADGSIAKAKLSAGVQSTLDKADSALQAAPVTSVNTQTGAVTLTKTDVGLGNVDNTADTAKPISSSTQTALDTKAPLASPTFTGTVSGVSKGMVGLGNVDNTSDANKPVSTATQTALNLKANTASLATVATSGSYVDLSNKPTIPNPSSFVSVVTGLSASASAGDTNATTIQAAIDAAGTAGGGQVIIPAGTWVTAPLALRTNVHLSGTSWNSVLKLKNNANTHFITLLDGNTEHTSITDLALDANGANQTSGNGVHLVNTGYTNNRAWPSSGDPNHYLHRVLIHDAKGHGVYTTGTWSQSHFDGVFSYDSGQNNFRIESPDNFLYNCVSARSALEGFYFAGNSNHGINLKVWLSGQSDYTKGQGYVVASVDRIDLIGCEAQDNRNHGMSLLNTTQANIVGYRANRNGLGAGAGAGGVGDGLYAEYTTNSRIDFVAYDHNNGGLKQRWGFNLGTGNDGNIVTAAIGVNQDSSVPGIGSWGAGSLVTMTWLGKPVAQPAAPMLVTTQSGTAYTLALGDMGTEVDMTAATAITVTVPPNSVTAYPLGASIIVRQYGAGQVTIAPGAGVTLRAAGGALKTAAQYAAVTLTKKATDEWFVDGYATT